MPVKELIVPYKGKKIRVKNTWFSGAKLYIDGDCRDTTQQLFSANGNKPILSTSIEAENEKEIIEVFITAILTVKIKIHVNGEFLAGEHF